MKNTFLSWTFIGFQKLRIAEPRGQIVGDIEKLEMFSLEAHRIVVSFNSELNSTIIYQVWHQKLFNSVQVVLSTVEPQYWQFSQVSL